RRFTRGESLSFVHWAADLPALHSFPTRRSSDLQRRIEANGIRHFERAHRHAALAADVFDNRRRDTFHQHFDAFSGIGAEAARSRSEEHTSELQSRENLVCRLLLEKNKKRPDTPA